MFKVGDKVEIIKPSCIHYKTIGIVKNVFEYNNCYTVGFSDGWYLYSEEALKLVDNLSERLTQVIKENQSLKQKISEQNIKLNKIQADMNRELRDKQGVSDEEFREALDFYENANQTICDEVWGSTTLSLIFHYNSLSEFVNKYKEYKQKKEKDKEINVGDEVCKQGSDTKYIVTAIDKTLLGDTAFRCMSEYGLSYSILNTEQLIKTGKHYDIQSILDGLKESD